VSQAGVWPQPNRRVRKVDSVDIDRRLSRFG